MGSRRLPGKVLMPIGEQTMLGHVVRRAGRAESLDGVIIATTLQPEDDAIVREAERLGAAVFRGSEDDVLDRYHGAARAFGLDAVVRITADCPLIDPLIVDRVVAAFLDRTTDYASNVLERTYPRGLDTEVISAAALVVAWREADRPHQRAHVTPFLYENPGRFRIVSVRADRDRSQFRWTVDTAADLDAVRALVAQLGGGDGHDWRAAVEAAERRPELAAINREVRQKELDEL